MSAPELERAQTRASNDSSPPKKQVGGARPLILRLHFYAGILIGPFILIAALSGGLYAMAPTIEKFVYSDRSEEHTSELQSLMRISYAVFCLKKKKQNDNISTAISNN